MMKDSESELTLSQSLTYELFDLGTTIDLVGQAAAGRLGINQTDLICLNLLTRHGPMSPGRVAAALGLTTAAISAMSTRLEAGGYATREMDPKDRRRVLLRASPAGTERAFSLFDGFYEATSELCGEYGDRDVRVLLEVIARFRQIISTQAAAINSSPPAPPSS